MQIRNEFRRPTSIADHQRHHLIPVAVFSNKHFAPHFETVKNVTDFDPADFGTNGILLPSTEVAALQTGQPLHRGPHPQYNEAVSYQIAAIFVKRAIMTSDVIRQHMLLRDLQRSLFRSLSDNLHNIVLNRRDPLARNVNFRRVDEELAAFVRARKPN